MKVKINSFYHTSITWPGATRSGLTPEEMREIVEANLVLKTPGDKPGTWVVPISGLFKSPTRLAAETETIQASFEARREGELKMLEFSAPGAEYATVGSGEAIIYEVPTLHVDWLRECAKAKDAGKEAPDRRSFYEEGDHLYEVVIFKAPAKEPGGLSMMVRNQLELKGGTPAKYTSEEWCRAVHFWLRHVKVG